MGPQKKQSALSIFVDEGRQGGEKNPQDYAEVMYGWTLTNGHCPFPSNLSPNFPLFGYELRCVPMVRVTKFDKVTSIHDVQEEGSRANIVR